MPEAVIIGVGPDRGLVAQLCKRFAAEGLSVSTEECEASVPNG
jgi:hypothetical protein